MPSDTHPFEPCYRLWCEGKPTIHRYEDGTYAKDLVKTNNEVKLMAKFETRPPEGNRVKYDAPDEIDYREDSDIWAKSETNERI